MLRRIQLGQLQNNFSSPAEVTVRVAALNVLTAVIQTLIFDIHYLTDSGFGISF
jgi:hypothetical protein